MKSGINGRRHGRKEKNGYFENEKTVIIWKLVQYKILLIY